jgi:glucose/arabinose dehydrogenase
MRITTSITTGLVALALCAGAALAQNATGAPASTQAQRAAQDATAHAQAVNVTLIARGGSGTAGSVVLIPIGSTRTRIVVRIPKGGLHRLALYQSADCYDSITRARTLVALTPLNNAGVNAPTSETIVNLPITQLQTQNYVVDVRNATNRQTFAEACAHLNGGH